MNSKPPPRRRARVLGLVAADHFFSHFYYLVVPPLFPLLTEVYGVGYTELGIGLMAMSLGNTLTAAPVGVLVDRFGARTPLIGGLALAGLCYVLIPLFPTYGALVFFMTLIGIANSVFHPANYAILDAIIPNAKVGRAFSVHSFRRLSRLRGRAGNGDFSRSAQQLADCPCREWGGGRGHGRSIARIRPPHPRRSPYLEATRR